MQTTHKIYIGLAVLVALGGLIYMQSSKSKQEEIKRSDPVAHAESLPNFKLAEADGEAVTKLVVKEKDKDEVVLEKRGEKWWVAKPIEALASEQNVKAAIDNLKSISAEDVINATADAPKMYKDYELDDAQALHVTAFKGEKGGDKVYEALFGKSGSRGQMARIGGKPGIWVVKGYSSFQLAREVKDWREKEMLKFEDANVVSFSIQNEKGAFSFSKHEDKWNGTFKGKAIEKFDQEKAKDMLRAFRNLNAQDFADDKSDKLAEIGLGEKPIASVEFVLKDDAGKPTLHFGNASTDSGRYAQKPGEKTVFIVGSWAADWVTADVAKFQTASDDKKDKDSEASKTPSDGSQFLMPSGTE